MSKYYVFSHMPSVFPPQNNWGGKCPHYMQRKGIWNFGGGDRSSAMAALIAAAHGTAIPVAAALLPPHLPSLMPNFQTQREPLVPN